MKAITLWQPWASLVAIGAKRVETRGWATKYRGPLAIHAALKWTTQQQGISRKDIFYNALWPQYNGQYVSRHMRELPLGAVIATCNLVDCIEIHGGGKFNIYLGNDCSNHIVLPVDSNEYHFGDYTPGRFAWILEDVKALPEPIFVKGEQGLWDWDGDVSGY